MHHSTVHYDYHLHHYFQNREITELYFSTAIRSFAVSMISIFVPAYFWSLGFSVREIALYFIIYYAVIMLLMPLCFKAAARWGIRHNMIIGMLISLLFFYLLDLVPKGFPYWIVAFIGAFYVSYYFSGYNADFARLTKKGKAGREMGLIRFFSSLFTLAGPLVGAIILTGFGFTALIIAVSIFTALAILPLLFGKDKNVPYHVSIRRMFRERNTKIVTLFEANGMIHVVSEVAWPLFIFIVLKTYFSLGWIVTFTSILIALFVLYIGKLTDKGKGLPVLTTGSSLHSVLWIIRYFITSGLSVFLVNLASSASFSMLDMPYSAFWFLKANRLKNPAEFFMMREWSMAIGRLVVLFFIFFTENLFSGFIIAAFASLVFLFLSGKVLK
jgi:MFS family permease